MNFSYIKNKHFVLCHVKTRIVALVYFIGRKTHIHYCCGEAKISKIIIKKKDRLKEIQQHKMKQ